MLTLEIVENFVKKFPELEFVHKKDNHYDFQHHYAVMKENPNYVVFEYHDDEINKDDSYIFLNTSIPMRLCAITCQFLNDRNSVQDNPYGNGYNNLNEMEKPLKKVIFMLDNLILVQKKMKMYEKKLDLESDFKG